jgi:peptidyl-prolyl cis-trans isomerase SurA
MFNNKMLVALISLVFIFNHIAAQDKIIDQVVAVIGTNIILKSEIESMHLQYQAQGITSEGDLKCDILEDLLVEKLMVAEAELDTLIIVTDNQINQQLEARIQYFIQHLGTEKEVEAYFKKPIVQLKSELKDIIRNEILSSQMKQKIIENITTTPSEVRQYFKTMPDEEIPLIKAQFEYAQITYIPQITEEEENAIKDNLRDIKRRIENGENFAMFAVLYSECPSSKNGGDLGFFGKATMDPAFSATAFALKPGQVSNVVKSESGYHIIQMNERMGERIRARHILIKPKVKIEVKEQLLNSLDSLGNAIRKDEITFEEAALRYSMDKNSRNNGGTVIHPGTLSSRFEIGALAPDISRRLTNMQIGEISKPFVTNDEKGREIIQMVKLITKIESHKANITEDYQLINDMFLEKKKNDAIQDWISKRQSKTYIRIDDTYVNCDFEYKNWIK